MLARLVITIAVLAASLGAPPTASAAVNDLLAPMATPGSGTTGTVFSFSVRYEGRFDASSVRAVAGARTVALVLTAGSRSSGTWSGSSTLPVGTWPVVFTATTAQGPSPSITGATLVVTAPLPTDPPVVATPPPTVPATPGAADDPSPGGGGTGGTRSGTDGTGGSGGSGGSSTDGAPTEPTTTPGDDEPLTAPDESGDGAASGDEPAPAPQPGSGSDGDDADEQPASAPASPEGQVAGGEGRPASDDGEAAPDDGGVATEPLADDEGPDGTHGDPDAVVTLVLVVGLAGVAAVAILGTLILLAGARRRSRDEEPEPAVETAAPVAPTESTDRVLERRAVRHARTRVGDDPIVAALGVDDEMAARRARRAGGQVNQGPGERPRPQRH